MPEAEELAALMLDMGKRARDVAKVLARVAPEKKRAAISSMAQAIMDNREKILEANAMDMESARHSNMPEAFLDRLELNRDRVQAMVDSLKEIASIDDPVGRILAEWRRPNGLHIKRVSVPIGVIGIVYESRPNVTSDAGALCLKAGNASILRSGADSWRSARAIHECMRHGLRRTGLPVEAIQIVPTTDRAAVGEMLRGLNANIDVIIPRGGKGLVSRVQKDARVPVFAHLEGLCHVYVDKSSAVQMAIEIVTNSKMRRTGICGAAETLLIDSAAADTHLCPILDALTNAGCIVRGEEAIRKLYPGAQAASPEDWSTEYLDRIIAARLVDGVEGAIEHINHYSSGHTEAIVAEDKDKVALFLNAIDSAILMHNASTQFADGGEFGMGAEIGIATGKMHARGPVGAEQLTSFKYLALGNGNVRP